MALILNDEQLMLRDTARHFLSESAPLSQLRELRDAGDNRRYSPDLWKQIVEMGWSGIVVPEANGGLGYGYTGMGLVLEECGRTLSSSPLLSTAMIGASALIRAGTDDQQNAILPGVVDGTHLLALASDEGSGHNPDTIDCAAKVTSDGFLLEGKKSAVLDGHIANSFIVTARLESGLSLFLVPADTAGVIVTPYEALDTHVMATVEFKDVQLDAAQQMSVSADPQSAIDYILDVARIGAAAELLGVAQEAFERTLDYLKQRKQFGVPIGSFQALQHRTAFLFGEIELCKSLALKALHALDEADPHLGELASLAKSKLGDTAHLATAEAIQMHGGIGMTDDFDIGFFIKRFRILDTLYGDRYFHVDRFARLRGY